MKTLTIVRTVQNIVTVYGAGECQHRDDEKCPSCAFVYRFTPRWSKIERELSQ